METETAFRSTMVSRLPKFGARSSQGGTNTLPNGSTQPLPQDGRSAHPNGVIRTPFSFRWKKDETVSAPSPITNKSSEDGPNIPVSSPSKEAKKSTPGTPKTRRSGAVMVAVSSPKPIPKHAAKTSPKISQPNGSSKVSLSESSLAVPESVPVKPTLRSMSPRSCSHDSLSHFSDSLKTLPTDNMVRSNSFTHFKQIPSPSSQTMTRSFSFNRAVELAKPLTNTQLRPPRSSLLKPPQLSNGRVGLGMGSLSGSFSGSDCVGMSLGGLHYNRMSPTASSLPTLSAPSAPNTPRSLKKPLLPNCTLNKSGNTNVSVGYKLPRSASMKRQPLLPGRFKEKVQPLAIERQGLIVLASESGNKTQKADFHSDSDGSSTDKSALCRKSSGQICGEALEDMSLSSASSLDRGDTSEEFLDDFDSTGEVLSDVDTSEECKISQSRLQRLLSNTVDWAHLSMEEPKEISPMDFSCGSFVLPPEPPSSAPAGSSLELSPSNSSGGTYMWDEDGLEPFHSCDTCDEADHNSLDILNTVEPLGAEELEDDDLMLDIELSDDQLHEPTSLMERSDRGRPGPRRRQRWNAPEHVHNGRLHGFQHYDAFKAPRFPTRAVYSEGKQPSYSPVPDELALEHMSQDCSVLKNHLLTLKRLLQFEDTDAPAHDAEDNSTVLQLAELLKEVQVLREELKSRDTTIAQLTLQCQQLQLQHQQMAAQGRQVRCQCHHQRVPHTRTADQQMDKRKQQHYDKATQTYWRPPAQTPQILQPFNPCLKEQHYQGRLTRAASTAGRSDRMSAPDCVVRPPDRHTAVDPERLSHLPSAQLQWPEGPGGAGGSPRGDTDVDGAVLKAQCEPQAPDADVDSSALTCPRMLQPPRLHKRVSLPALKPGVAGGCPLWSKQLLPPPSRGLPCFNTGPQVPAPSVIRTSVLQPNRDLQSTESSPEQLSRGKLRQPATLKIPIPASRSCLHKPKIS